MATAAAKPCRDGATVVDQMHLVTLLIHAGLRRAAPARPTSLDNAKQHTPRFCLGVLCYSAAVEEMGVYLGGFRAQSRFRIGFGGLMFNAFNCLATSGSGSVTCQTRPLGLAT